MKKVKIFLASSAGDLCRDKTELGAFVSDLNDRYAPCGLYFHLIMAEDCESEAAKKEAENCELFYILFGSGGDARSLDVFNSAYDAFSKNKRPRITTYFKKLQQGEYEHSVLDFMYRLDKELGHYYNHYAGIDAVKLNLMLQIKSLGLDPLSDGYAEAGQIIALDNIPIFSNNKQLSQMKADSAKLEQDFLQWQKKARQNPDDKDTQKTFFRLSQQRNTAQKAIQTLQDDIFALEESFFQKSCLDGVTPRQKCARECLEEGDIDGAEQALDAQSIQDDQKAVLIKLKLCRQELRMRADEWLQRAEVLRLNLSDSNRFAKIEEAYEQAVRLEREGGLERRAELLYAHHLTVQKQYDKAAQMAKDYLHHIQAGASNPAEQREVFTLLGCIHMELKDYAAAEQYYEQALSAVWQMDLEPELKELHLVFAYRNLADVSFRMNKMSTYFEDAGKLLAPLVSKFPFLEPLLLQPLTLSVVFDEDESALSQMEQIYNRLLRNVSVGNENSETALAEASRKMGTAYASMDKNDLAETCFRRGLALRERLAAQNPAAYGTALAGDCQNTAGFCERIGKTEEAEALYLRSIELWEEGTEPEASAEAYLTLADFYRYTKQEEKEEEARYNASRLYLAMEPPQYNPGAFARTLANLASYFYLHNRFAEMETLSQKAIPQFEAFLLCQTQPDAIQPFWSYAGDYAELVRRLSDGYRKSDRVEDALILRQKTSGFWRQALEMNPGYFEKTAVSAFCELAGLYEKRAQPLKAAQQYEYALACENVPPAEELAAMQDASCRKADFEEIALKLARIYTAEKEYQKAEPPLLRLYTAFKETQNESRLCSVCTELAGLYKETDRFAKAEDFYREALELQKRQAEQNHFLLGSVGTALHNISKLYESANRLEEAETYLSEAYAVWQEAAKTEPMYADILPRAREKMAKLKQERCKHETD